jgi:hypothetical protein
MSNEYRDEEIAQSMARFELIGDRAMRRAEALSLSDQVEFYKERVIQMRHVLIQATPIVEDFDRENSELGGKYLSDDLRALSDLSMSAIRCLYFPSRNLSENNLREGLSQQELWDACLDRVLAMNRGFGVSTTGMEKVSGAPEDRFQYGKVAHDPLRTPIIPPKSFMYRVLAKLVGAKRLKKFVNHNCDIHQPGWLVKDVLDD